MNENTCAVWFTGIAATLLIALASITALYWNHNNEMFIKAGYEQQAGQWVKPKTQP